MSEKKPETFDDLYRQAKAHDDYWIADAVQAFTERVFQLMEEQKSTRSELARRLGTTPAYVTKILRGNANFTLASMVKLARVFGTDLRIELTPRERSRQKSTRPSARGSAGEGAYPADGMAARPAR
ncbi:MAG: helix-turn-helix transcriptional regulator [bacterium]|nr:helix-turn-helix transcriptional regulator [bacterium]